MCDGGCPEKQVCDYCQPSSGKDASAPQPPKVQIDLQAVREVITQLQCTDESGLNAEPCYQLGDKLSRAIGDTP